MHEEFVERWLRLLPNVEVLTEFLDRNGTRVQDGLQHVSDLRENLDFFPFVSPPQTTGRSEDSALKAGPRSVNRRERANAAYINKRARRARPKSKQRRVK